MDTNILTLCLFFTIVSRVRTCARAGISIDSVCARASVAAWVAGTLVGIGLTLGSFISRLTDTVVGAPGVLESNQRQHSKTMKKISYSFNRE